MDALRYVAERRGFFSANDATPESLRGRDAAGDDGGGGALFRDRGDPVEICRKCKRCRFTSERESRLKVESIVNSCVEA